MLTIITAVAMPVIKAYVNIWFLFIFKIKMTKLKFVVFHIIAGNAINSKGYPLETTQWFDKIVNCNALHINLLTASEQNSFLTTNHFSPITFPTIKYIRKV